MVSVGVSCLGCTDVHFLEPGVKVDGEYYRDVVLKQMLLPDIKHISGDDCFVFQQDSTPAYRAKMTIDWIEYTSIHCPSLWPPNSPDLNPVDHCVWGILKEIVL